MQIGFVYLHENYKCMITKSHLLVLIFLISSLVAANNTTTAISDIKGVVVDSYGEPLIGATVSIENTNHYGIAGLDGSYIIKNIPEGDYKIKVEFYSFKTLTQEVSVTENGTIELNFTLEDDLESLGEVVVVAEKANGDSQLGARQTERESQNVVNVISGQVIDQSPDITVANVLQRVSGVSIERDNSGDGQFAIIRGMDKRYNYTLVNGIKIPSPDPRNRYVPLDIFPADLLDRLEVTKALTPDMEGDAIGGVMDLIMKDAPSELKINANIGTGYNQLFIDRPFRRFNSSATQSRSPRDRFGNDHSATIDDFTVDNLDFQDYTPRPHQIYNFSIGNRFFDKKLGVLVAGSYQNTFRGANSLFFDTDVSREDNKPFYDNVQERQFSNELGRMGVHAKLDYKINKNHKIDMYNAFMYLSEDETRTRIDTNLRIGRAGQGVGTGRVELGERARVRRQQIYNTTLKGKHQITKKFDADWSAVYSFAKNNEPDLAELVKTSGVRRNPEGELVVDPVILDRDFRRRWTNNSDTDLAGYLNLNYRDTYGNLNVDYSVGGMFRNKERDNFYDRYLFRTSPITQEWNGDVFEHTWNLFNTQGTPTDPLNYESYEDVRAYYGMAKIKYGDWRVMGGVRVENTEFGWETDGPPQLVGRTGSIDYTDILPSLHLRYSPVNEFNVKASYFKSIARPNFFEVIPYQINEDDFRERGNPDLQRTRADNYDVRFEYYPGKLDQIMLGFFTKRITDPIETALFIDGQAIFLQPNNFGTATNRGIEFDFTKYFRDFGVRAFYTYTDSQITTSKIVRFRNDEGSLTSREEDQTRPLQGQSDHIANISLLYKNQKYKWDIQLAAVYTGERIISVSPYLDNDIWQEAFTQLDLSIEKGITENLTIYTKINNLLNTPLRANIKQENTFNAEQVPYLDVSRRTLVREDFYQMTVLAGVKLSF